MCVLSRFFCSCGLWLQTEEQQRITRTSQDDCMQSKPTSDQSKAVPDPAYDMVQTSWQCAQQSIRRKLRVENCLSVQAKSLAAVSICLSLVVCASLNLAFAGQRDIKTKDLAFVSLC